MTVIPMVSDSALVTPRGVEPLEKTSGKRGVLDVQRAKSSAIESETSPIDPDLQLIVERWDNLSTPVKAGILAMIRAS